MWIKTRKTKSAKADLVFPAARVDRYLRERKHVTRLGATAPVFLAAVLEYLCAEVLVLAGIEAEDKKKNRITPHHINLAKINDYELDFLLKDVTIAGGGVKPTIEQKKKNDKEDKENE